MRHDFAGHGASRGLALGRARVRLPHALEMAEQRVPAAQADAEARRLHEALEAARAEMRALREKLQGALSKEAVEFIDLHALLLDDPELVQALETLVRQERYSAGYALRVQRDRLAAVFEQMDDPYLRSRLDDLDHIIGRIKYGKNDPLPMISILEAPIPLEAIRTAREYEMSSGPWELLIQGFIDDDLDNPSDPAHHLMAEVKAVLVKNKRAERGNNILGMGGRVVEMTIGQGSVRPSDEASDKGFFWLTLTIRVVENLEEPYE